jgi:MFS transporter, FSR family, fosmidomycin resistance protein
MRSILTSRRMGGAAALVLVLLVIEFLDELVFSTREASLPLIRDALNLSYDQIGILLGVPILFANLIEPFLFILGDVWKRKAIVVIGGVLFTVGLFVTAVAQDFWVLLIAFLVLAPASGMFVALSQAVLMDTDPERHEQNMARWTLAGSLGVVVGPLMLSLVLVFGGDWRLVFAAFSGLSLLVLVLVLRQPFPQQQSDQEEKPDSFVDGVRKAFAALRRGTVLRWLALLQMSDLMLDVLLSYLALYMVDVAGVDEGRAAVAVAVWTGVGLLGDALLIPLLERIKGLTYLRITTVIELTLFPVFLLVPDYTAKLVILGLMGFFNSGAYAILQGQLYSAMPGQSGAVLALGSLSGVVGGLIPMGIGLAAERLGLGAAIWLLLAGPIAILIGLPKASAFAKVELE